MGRRHTQSLRLAIHAWHATQSREAAPPPRPRYDHVLACSGPAQEDLEPQKEEEERRGHLQRGNRSSKPSEYISGDLVTSVHRALVLRFRGPSCGGIVQRARRSS